jgi:transcription factor WhiB
MDRPAIRAARLQGGTVNWWDRAACRPGNGAKAAWFDAAIRGETDDDRNRRHHLAIITCAACPVQQACLDEALRDPKRDGVHAGYVLEIERTDP